MGKVEIRDVGRDGAGPESDPIQRERSRAKFMATLCPVCKKLYAKHSGEELENCLSKKRDNAGS